MMQGVGWNVKRVKSFIDVTLVANRYIAIFLMFVANSFFVSRKKLNNIMNYGY